jgi:hypothetical protein
MLHGFAFIIDEPKGLIAEVMCQSGNFYLLIILFHLFILLHIF